MNERIRKEDLRNRLEEEKRKGSRLMMITAEERGKERFLIYHLDEGDEGRITNLEIKLKGNKADRITDIFENADLYEKECREMFGLDFGEEMENLFLPEEAEEPPMSNVERAIHSENKGGHCHA